MKCPKCKGKNKFVAQEIEHDGCMEYTNTNTCNFCYGQKNLDWIEFIFGVKRDFHYFEKYWKDVEDFERRIKNDK
jgi:hypothetical protein